MTLPTCVKIFGESSINDMAIEVCHANVKAQNSKNAKYLDLVIRLRFEPVVRDTPGMFGFFTKNT